MDLITEFRRHADECRRMARATVNVDEVAAQEERALAGTRSERERHRGPRLAGRPQQAA